MATTNTGGPSAAPPSIHRRNRDLDVILFFFVCLFLSFEFTRFMNYEEVELEEFEEELGEKYQILKNDTLGLTDDGLFDGTTNGSEDHNTDDHGDSEVATAANDAGPDERPSIAVNWEYILDHQPCSLMEDDDVPLPLVFVALGRTGSSITWNTIAKMTMPPGRELTVEPDKAIEIVGRNRTEAPIFFNGIPDKLAKTWPSSYICDLQRNFTTTGGMEAHGALVGFQWKPYMGEFNHDNSLNGFHDIASDLSLSESSPHRPIRVIWQTRNPIDRKLSNMRHKKSNNALSPHCAVGDDECIRKHEESSSESMEFTTGKDLIHWLKVDKKHHERVAARLDSTGISYLHVSYDILYGSDNDEDGVKEWKKIFDFLGRGPGSGKELTMEEIRRNFGMAKTSSKTHEDMMENYDEVKATLEGTEFAHYLN